MLIIKSPSNLNYNYFTNLHNHMVQYDLYLSTYFSGGAIRNYAWSDATTALPLKLDPSGI